MSLERRMSGTRYQNLVLLTTWVNTHLHQIVCKKTNQNQHNRGFPSNQLYFRSFAPRLFGFFAHIPDVTIVVGLFSDSQPG